MAKTKALISCAVTAQLICTLVFAYAKVRFFHNKAHMIKHLISCKTVCNVVLVKFVISYVIYEPRCEMVRGFKFRIEEVEGLYYQCSKNKGTDQLHGYREADLRLCFLHMQKAGFLTTWLIYFT